MLQAHRPEPRMPSSREASRTCVAVGPLGAGTSSGDRKGQRYPHRQRLSEALRVYVSAARVPRSPGGCGAYGAKPRPQHISAGQRHVLGRAERAACKTVGSAYVGSNPTPATTCKNAPLAANSRASGAFFSVPACVALSRCRASCCGVHGRIADGCPCGLVGRSGQLRRSACAVTTVGAHRRLFHGRPRTGHASGVFRLDVRLTAWIRGWAAAYQAVAITGRTILSAEETQITGRGRCPRRSTSSRPGTERRRCRSRPAPSPLL